MAVVSRMGGGMLDRPVERWLKIAALALIVASVVSYVGIFVEDLKRAFFIRGLPLLQTGLLQTAVDRLVSLVGLLMKAFAFYGFGCIIGLVKQRMPKGSHTGSSGNIVTIGLAALASLALAIGIGLFWIVVSFVMPIENRGSFTVLQVANLFRGATLAISFGLTLVGLAQVAGRLSGKHEPIS